MSEQLSVNSKKHLVIFDGHALAFHSWFTSEPPEVMSGFFEMIDDAIVNHSPSHIIVTFDPPPPTFRHLLYPEYKANRPPVPEGLLEDCERVLLRLNSENISSCSVQGYEADDVIGSLSLEATELGFTTSIITSDLDLLQLVNKVTEVEIFSQYWPTRNFDQAAVFNRFHGLAPKNIPDFKAFVGDKSDNLPGVTGIGEKSASVILNHFSNLENIYSDLDQILELPVRGAKRVRNILAQNQELAFFMRTMTTVVCNVPTGINIDQSALRLSTD